MGNLVLTYQHIAAILSFETPNSHLEQRLNNPSFDWDAIVIEGSKHLVLPAIYCRLKAKQLLHVLPEELQEYLEGITSINRNRNKSILKQVHFISQLLNANDINHVFLKGSALLALGCYEDNAERMVGDIDILVSKPQLQLAFELIKTNGYSKTSGFAYETIGYRHLDRLIAPEELAAIELHSDLLRMEYRDLIDLNNVLMTKIHVGRIAIPTPSNLNKHQILAWQLNDQGHYYNAISFKSLYDCIILKAHSNPILLLDLLKYNFGQSYFGIAKHYFRAFDSIQLTEKSNSYRNLHLKYIKNPFYRKVLKPLKQGYSSSIIRLKLVVNNKFYREHLLKKIFILKK